MSEVSMSYIVRPCQEGEGRGRGREGEIQAENFLVSRRRQTLFLKEGQADGLDSIQKAVATNTTWIPRARAVCRALA